MSTVAEKNIDHKQARLRYIDRPKAYSLGIFFVASVVAIGFFRDYVWVFVVLLVLDSTSTYYDLSSIIGFDRISYAAVFLVLSTTVGGFTGPQLILESFVLIVFLDLSLLLRKVGESPQALRVIFLRIRSYSYTLFLGYLISFTAITAYSYFSSSTPEPILVFGLSSAGILVIIFALVRYSIKVVPSSYVPSREDPAG